MDRMQSKAAVFDSPGLPLRMVDFPVPDPGPGEVLVRIRCATICGSDLHTIFGRRHSPTPSILGHEMVGDIAASGAGRLRDFFGRPLAIGDRVTWSMVWSCGDCYYCDYGLPSKCEHLFKFGHERIGGRRDLTGAYAEYCILPAGTAIFPVPANVPDLVAAPSNCATATVSAVLRNAGSVAGATVLVMGTGMLGLTACAMARAEGAAEVIAVERAPRRRELAWKFGATVLLDPEDSLLESIRAATGGHGVDCILEFAGTPEAGESALPLLRAGGHLVMAGAVFPARPMSVPAEDIVRRLLRVTGVYNYRPEDLGHALRFLSEQMTTYPFEDLIAARYPLSEINTAIGFSESEKPPRTAVFPDWNLCK
ncbi:MAG: zinc-binding dehydrogenase [Bryobacterales bacterium]|nr:zinc-binding dehydrogenase [Bryobacterales bacterium]